MGNSFKGGVSVVNNPKEIIKTYTNRFACKEFDPDKRVSKEDILTILEVGRLSPSSFGFEPWKFLVIENEYLREKIATVSWGLQRQLPTISYLVILLARKGKSMIYHSPYIRYMMEDIQGIPEDMINLRLDRYKNFQEEDFKLLDDDRSIFDWASKQTYIVLSNMMTAASQLGIDSCPIEGFHREKLECLLEKEGILDLDEFGVSNMVVFGYRNEDPEREKTRRPFNEVVEWIK